MYFPAPAALRDSRLRLSDLREIVLVMLSRAVTAFVPFMTHGPTKPTDWADRTPFRPMLVFVARLAAFVRGKPSYQPDLVWTITHEMRMTPDHVRSAHSASGVPDHHIHNHNRSGSRAESPREYSGAAFDETRNSYQRDASRDARRDPRGRSARRAAG